MKLLIDGDPIVYRIGFASQKRDKETGLVIILDLRLEKITKRIVKALRNQSTTKLLEITCKVGTERK